MLPAHLGACLLQCCGVQCSVGGARATHGKGAQQRVTRGTSSAQAGNTPASYDPERTRTLLLNKKEIARLANADAKKGLTLVPIKWYNKSRLLKLEVAVARHKKKYDKRQTLKERDTKRAIERTLKTQR